MKNIRRDKRGIAGIILFFVVLFVIMIAGFLLVVGSGILGYASDTITPVMTSIGMVGDTNVSQASENSFGVADNIIQSLPWLIAFAYVMALIFSIVLVTGYNYNPNPAFIAVYIALIMLLIVGSIAMSNVYQDLYEGNDELASKLQDQTAMSYMILYAPFILTAIAFITGIFLFAGNRQEGGYV